MPEECFKIITGIDAFSILLFILVITGIYTIIGGLRAEIFVNILHVFFISIVVIAFYLWVIVQKGSFSLILNQFSFSSNPGFKTELSWTGILGLPILGFWFWCADQFIVQKVTGIRTKKIAQKTILFSILMQVFPVLLFLLPGIVLLIFSPNFANDDILSSLFSGNFLPDILRDGLIIAVAAALMASLANFFNSTTLLVTFDFYKNHNRNASERKLVLVGRLTTLFLLFLAILFVPISQSLNFEICISLFKIFSYFSSLIVAVFLVGLLNKKINANNILFSLGIGTAVILFRAVFEFGSADQVISNSILLWFGKSEFLQFTTFIFLLSILLSFVSNKIELIRFSPEILQKKKQKQFPRLNMKKNLHQIE